MPVRASLVIYICQGTNQNPSGFGILSVEIKNGIFPGKNQNCDLCPSDFKSCQYIDSSFDFYLEKYKSESSLKQILVSCDEKKIERPDDLLN